MLEKITFGDAIPGWIGGEKGRPAIIVLQEWWGITEEIKNQAEFISKTKNYRVLVPDLYRGKMGVDAEEASHLMNNLDWNKAADDMLQAEKHLRDEGATKTGAIGFCMGGALALIAAEVTKVDAAVGFYGTPDPKLGKGVPEKITVPVQTHSGTDDSFKGFADPPTVKPWTERVPGGKGEFHEYPGEGHAFMNSGGDILQLMEKAKLPTDIKKQSRDLAWDRVFAFFGKHLG